MKFPNVSLIIVNYNGKGYVEDCIESFLRTDYPNFEIIFVDNNSNDDSYEIVKKARIKTARNRSNLGFTGGCNRGLELSHGKYIVLINNDDKAANPNWLKELVKTAHSDPTIGACFGKKLQWDYPHKIDSVGGTIDRAGFIKQIREGEKDNGQYDRITERFVWQTPVLIRREIVEKVGGLFDPKYFILHDDTDLSWRIWLAGYKIVFVPTSVVYHKRSATIKKLPPHIPAFHGKKNIIMTILRNYKFKNLAKFLPITVLVFIGMIGYYLTKKRADLALSTLKAILWNLMNIGEILKGRRIIQRRVRKVGDDKILKLMDQLNLENIMKRRAIWP